MHMCRNAIIYIHVNSYPVPSCSLPKEPTRPRSQILPIAEFPRSASYRPTRFPICLEVNGAEKTQASSPERVKCVRRGSKERRQVRCRMSSLCSRQVFPPFNVGHWLGCIHSRRECKGLSRCWGVITKSDSPSPVPLHLFGGLPGGITSWSLAM